MIVGLPPPREGCVTYCRGLEESLLLCVLRNLRGLMDDGITTLRAGPCQELVHFNKYRQLHGLLRSLLAREGEGLDLSPELEDLLDDVGEHRPLDLRTLRAFNMHQLQFVRSWPDNSLVRPFAAGNYGYIPDGSMDLANFEFLGNIQDSGYHKEIMQVVGLAECKLFGSEHGPVICPPMATSSISDERDRWQIPLPLSESSSARVSYEMRLNPVEHAREFLVAHGASLASKHGVEAQDLILVTRSQREYYYLADEWSRLSHTRHSIKLDSTASDGPAFPVPVLPLRSRPWCTSSLLPGRLPGLRHK
ncbi:hypothetical protein BC826DRAFT_689636 [Russula brevipes]|nr:hypothetical protein BC826DRAFT_689636 [Russula brevipes]